MNDLLEAQFDRRIPEILAAAVRERAPIAEVWTCPGPGDRDAAAMGAPPPPDNPAWQRITPGERWGMAPGDAPDWEPPRLDWEIAPTGGSTHWLSFRLEVPPPWRGRSVHLTLGWVGNRLDQVESIVYLDGAALAGLDWGHRTTLLPPETHERGGALLIRCAVAFPRPFGGVELQLRDEAIFRLGHTMRALLDAARTMATDLPVRHRLLGALGRAYQALDLREGWQSERFAASATAALDELDTELRALDTLPATGPTILTSGHGHLDVAWLWPLWRTRQKVAHTVASALQLMERYPDYHFSMSQPQVYAYLKHDDPALYARLKQRVTEGRFEPVGMMWVESDCNLPSGEALIRQFVHGRRFLAEEFPERYGEAMNPPHMVWLPDVFGFSGGLPQILRGCGVSCFMTTKLSWNQTNRYPADTFRWRGIDGSEVLAHLLTTSAGPARHPSEPHWFAYGGPLGAGEAAGVWRHYRHQGLTDELMALFGHADGGGGPNEEMLETLAVLQSVPGLPRIRHGRADQFFVDLYRRVWDDPRLPTWVGELYFEYHRGTYTSQAGVKRANRAAELQYRQAEWLNAWATLTGATCRQARLDEGWRIILLNQFHDILPGSSIAAVYADAHAGYADARAIGEEVSVASLASLTAGLPAGPLVINSLPWERIEAVRLPLGVDEASTWVNHPTTQVITERPERPELLLDVTVPSFGLTTIPVQLTAHPTRGMLQVARNRLANDELELVLDEHGEICSLYDRRYERELVPPGRTLNQLVLYEDRPLEWDAWDIDPFYEQKPYPVHELFDWEVAETGPIRAAISIRRRFGRSELTQRICLWRGNRRIDIITEVAWQERQMLLRALFPLNLNAVRATCEIQFGAIERSTHRNTSWDRARFEVCAHRWVDLSEGGYGVALLNDGLYGHSFLGSTVGISLLKGAIFPDPDADRGWHRFTYSLYPHAGDWRAAQVVRRAYELNAPLMVYTPPGDSGVTVANTVNAVHSFLTLSADHVVAETIKTADDGDGLIVRLYEAHNQRGAVALTFDRPVRDAEETDLLERTRGPVDCAGHVVRCTVRPFEIKTLRVRFREDTPPDL